ncbi:taste receptor type 2 member 4-like [Pelodytes ibericus]
MTPYQITVLTVTVITFIEGFLANGFIVAVYSTDRLGGREMKASDNILLSLSISRMCYQCLSLLRTFSFAFLPPSPALEVTIVTSTFLEIVFFYTSLWFVTLLSILYFLKIANYSHAFFLRLKTMISRRILLFIVVAVLISVCNTCLHIKVSGSETGFDNSTQNLSTGDTDTCRYRANDNYIYVFILGNSGPFLIYSTSSVLLFTSLYHHIKQMSDSNNGFTTSHLNSYYMAIKSMAVCFLFYGLQVGTNILCIFCNFLFGLMWTQIFLNFFPALHSNYLIYGTPKLRQLFTHRVQQGVNCVLNRGDGEPNSTRQLESINQ